MTRRGWLGLGYAALALLALAAGFFLSWHWYQGSGLVGEPAPDVRMTDLAGQTHAFGQPSGKLLLVNFWAPWCSPCLEEIPHLVEAQARYGARGLQVLGPALDERASVEAMARRLHINYPVSANTEEAIAASDALGDRQGVLPYSVLIGRDGRVLRTITGGLTADELRRLIEKHL